jgi:hypothetical protein
MSVLVVCLAAIIESGVVMGFRHPAALPLMKSPLTRQKNALIPFFSISPSTMGSATPVWNPTASMIAMIPTTITTNTNNLFRHELLLPEHSTASAWSNPATERLKSMVAATLWGIPLLLLVLVVIIAILFSAIMPVIDKMFYENLEYEMRLYLPNIWTDYLVKLNGEPLSSRTDLQMELWDQLLEYKAERLREIYTSRRTVDDNDDDYYMNLWQQIVSQREEGEELENRPDLIAKLEEGLLKSQEYAERTASRRDLDLSTKDSRKNTFLSKTCFQQVVGNELNRVDLIMRLFDTAAGYLGTSRQQIYQDWEEERKRTTDDEND